MTPARHLGVVERVHLTSRLGPAKTGGIGTSPNANVAFYGPRSGDGADERADAGGDRHRHGARNTDR